MNKLHDPNVADVYGHGKSEHRLGRFVLRGLLGDPYGLKGKTPSREYQCAESPEGLIAQGFIGGGRVGGMYPPRKARPPETPEMFELLPVGPYGAIFYLLCSEKEDVYKPPPWPKMLRKSTRKPQSSSRKPRKRSALSARRARTFGGTWRL